MFLNVIVFDLKALESRKFGVHVMSCIDMGMVKEGTNMTYKFCIFKFFVIPRIQLGVAHVAPLPYHFWKDTAM